MGLGLGFEEPTLEPEHFEPDMIYLEDLLRRWQGITPHDLLQLIVSNRLKAYVSTKDLIDSDGVRVHKIEPLRPYKYDRTKPLSHTEGVELALAKSKVVFKIGEVSLLEYDNEHLTWRSGTPTSDNTPRCFNPERSDKYAGDRLSRRWRCSPNNVLAVLDNRREGALKYHPDRPIPEVERLTDFYVMHHDLMQRERDHEANDFRPELKSTAKVPQTELNSVAKTAKATDAKQDKTAKDWAECLKTAVALAVECAQSGKPKSKQQHMAMWKKRWEDSKAAEPHRDAFRAFREGLPLGLKHKSDAAS